MLKTSKIPPTIHYQHLNEHIELKESPFYVNTECKDWGVTAGQKRCCAISSFGFSGTNAHAVIEEYVEKENVEDRSKSRSRKAGEMGMANLEDKEPYLVVLSAKNEERLKEVAKNLHSYLTLNGESETVNLRDLVYTLQIGRVAMEERVALVISSLQDLTEKLDQYLQGTGGVKDLYQGNINTNKENTRLLVDGASGQVFLQAAIDNREFEKLGQLWVSGVEIDWRLMLGETTPKRISLPTYPFARERYWIDTISEACHNPKNFKSIQVVRDNNSFGASQEIGTRSNEKIKLKDQNLTQRNFPLGETNAIAKKIELRSLSERKKKLYFDGRVLENGDIQHTLSIPNTILIREHTVFGYHVLPTDSLIEMVFQGAVRYFKSVELSFQNVFIMNPIVSLDNRLTQAHLAFKQKGEATSFEINSYVEDDGAVISKNVQGLVSPHTGNLEFANRHQQLLADSENVPDFECISKNEHPLQTGEFFRSLKKVVCKGNEALGIIRLSEKAQSYCGQFLLHPSIFDSLLGTIVYLIETMLEKERLCSNESYSFIPVYIHQLDIIRPLEDEEYYAYVKVTQVEEEFARVDAELIDSSHNMALRILGLDEKRITMSNLKKSVQNLIAGVGKKEEGKEISTGEFTELDTNPGYEMELPVNNQEKCLSELRNLLSETLLLEPAKVDISKKFLELGLDSILGMEYIHKINQKYNLNLRGTVLYEHSSLSELQAHFWAEYPEVLQSADQQNASSGKHEKDRDTNSSPWQGKDYSGISKEELAFVGPRRSDLLQQSSSENTSGAKTDPACATELPVNNQEKCLTELRNLLSETLLFEPAKVGTSTKFPELGMDSILGMEYIHKINRRYNLNLRGTVLYEHSSLFELHAYIWAEYPEFLQSTDKQIASSGKHEKDGFTNPSPWESNDYSRIGKEELAPVGLRRSDLWQQSSSGNTPNAIPESVIWSKAEGQTETQRKVSSNHNDDRISASRNRERDIAIIGVSARFPKSRTLEELWDHLIKGDYLITEVPKDHWDIGPWSGDDSGLQPKIYCNQGGFIEDVDKFDPLFFKIPPREAEIMDPQLRHLLEVVWESAEDAGYGQTIKGSKTGVFVGNCFNDYSHRFLNGNEIDYQYSGTGNSNSSLSNRISYVLDLIGPSLTLDTACSSSLVALHLACASLRRRETELCLVGGVNLSLSPGKYLTFCEMGALSKKSMITPFDEVADGYIPGEGIACILLKPLAKALKDNDQIYGVIKGSSVAHGGYSGGPTVPNPKQQTQVMMNAWEDAQVNPETISYYEAHGTGTALGDPLEINALKQAFSKYTKKTGFCHIGTIKANIGHTEATAGLAGVIKVLLMMRYRQIPLLPKLGKLNPMIELEKTPLHINLDTQEWKNMGSTARRAGVSSFGMGGTFAHVVIEEYLEKAEGRRQKEEENNVPHLIVLSAKTKERLREMAKNLHSYITVNGKPQYINLRDLGYTLQVGREAMEERLGIIVVSIEELAEKLQGFLSGQDIVENLYQGQVKSNKETSAIFAADEELQEAIVKWIRRRKYSKLLDLWVKGIVIDWNTIYGDSKPHRISLPTYPFAKERHWISDSIRESLNHKSKFINQNSSLLHSLLHKNTSDLSKQRFSSTFRGEEFFLADHIVKGKKILPGVAYLEMAHEAVKQASRGFSENNQGILLKNVVWTRPIVVNEPKEVHIGLFPEKNGEIAYEIYTQTQNMDEEPQIHSQGVAALILLENLPSLDLTDLREKLNGNSLNPRECYDIFKQIGIEYGPAHQGLEKIHVGVDEVLAKLTVPDSVSDTKDYFTLHPSLLDSALQASIGIGIGEEAVNGSLRPSLPFALEHIKIMARCPKSIWAWVRVARHFDSDGSVTDKVRKLDIDLYDEDGKVFVEMQGFSSRILEGEISEAPEVMGTLMFTPAWKEKSVDPDQQFGEYTKHRVFLCGLTQISQRLQDNISHISFTDLESDQNPLEDCFKAYSLQLFEAIQKILQEKPTGDVLIQVLFPDHGPKQVFSGLSGLLRSVRLENPKILCQMIAVEEDEREEDLIEKVQANAQFSEDQEIRYEGEQRFVSAFEEMGRSTIGQDVPWKNGGVYLITGGAGGLGLIFAREIADKVQGATLILTGRSKLSAPKKGNLEKLQSLGATIIYRSVDVCDKEALEILVQEIQANFGSLNGIIHGAGVIRDSSILKKSNAEFGQVLAPKVLGLINLDQVSKTLDLDIFVLFSSGAGATGNVGQADYSTANAFMDTFARYRSSLQKRKERGGQTLSINWPLWRAGGMRVDEATEAMMKASTGMVPMETSSGIEAFYQALASDAPQVMVMEGLVKQMKQKLLSSARKVSKVKTLPAPRETTPEIDKGHLIAKIQETLTQMVSKLLKVKPEDLDVDAELSEYGVDSIMLTDFANRLNQTYQLELTPTILFETPTIGSFAKYLVEEHQQVFLEHFKVPTQESSVVVTEKVELEEGFRKPRHRSRFVETISSPPPGSKRSGPIAVVGMSGCFPMARDINQFWQNLIEGKNCITEIPKNRWDWESIYGDPNKEEHKTKIKWGGFIEGIGEFDPLFFDISPREAELMDPQQRLLLTYVWQAIEDAGISPKDLSQASTGTFIAAGPGEYTNMVSIPIDSPLAMTGMAPSMIPNRISYGLNLRGPSEYFETACSSALVAMHHAFQSIHFHNCEQAIVGAVNLLLSPRGFMGFESMGFLSPEGEVKPFQADADGYVRSEGAGALVLKPLQKAIDNQDHIYAVVKGTGVYHGGKGMSLTTPNPAGMKEAMFQAYTAAAIDPRTVSYIEAHGIASPLADSIEVNALRSGYEEFASSYGKNSYGKTPCYVGSLKPCIGHGEMVSGMAALIKVISSLRHHLIPGVPRFTTLNEDISLKGSSLRISAENRSWEALTDKDGKTLPRRASINSYGFGGVNAHVVVEEYIGNTEDKNAQRGSLGSPNQRVQKLPEQLRGQSPRTAGSGNREAFLIILSAKSQGQLNEMARNLFTYLTVNFEPKTVNLGDIAYTLQVGREAMEQRLALLVRDNEELVRKLESYIENTEMVGEDDDVFMGDVGTDGKDLRILLSDRVGKDLTQQAVKLSDLKKVGLLWCRGVDIPWGELYQGVRPQRISLPTYPFSKRRYWLPVKGGQPSSIAKTNRCSDKTNRCANTCQRTALLP